MCSMHRICRVEVGFAKGYHRCGLVIGLRSREAESRDHVEHWVAMLHDHVESSHDHDVYPGQYKMLRFWNFFLFSHILKS